MKVSLSKKRDTIQFLAFDRNKKIQKIKNKEFQRFRLPLKKESPKKTGKGQILKQPGLISSVLNRVPFSLR